MRHVARCFLSRRRSRLSGETYARGIGDLMVASGLNSGVMTVMKNLLRVPTVLLLASMGLTGCIGLQPARSEEHTSELQSLMRISYAVFCLKKKKETNHMKNNYDNSKTIQEYK